MTHAILGIERVVHPVLSVAVIPSRTYNSVRRRV